MYLIGADGGKTITASLPETASDAEVTFYEVMAHKGQTAVKDLICSMKNGRYACHVDSSATRNKSNLFFNCDFYNLGSQEVIDYRIANAQAYNGIITGNTACGLGGQYGHSIYYKDCNIYGINPLSWHTNVAFTSIAKLTLFNTNCIAQAIFNTNLNPDTELKASVILQSLTSELINPVNIFKGSANGGIRYTASYYSSTKNTLYILNDILLSQYSITATFDNAATVGGSLKITSATDGTVDTVAGTGATALTTAVCDYDDNYAIGRLEVGEEWESTNPNINIGTRLGDCSGTNKTMTLNVDGVAKTITFNENFSARDNAYCLAFINTALDGSATASLYQRASENEPVILT